MYLVFYCCCYCECISDICPMSPCFLRSNGSDIKNDLRRTIENPSTTKKLPCPWKILEWSFFQRKAERRTTTEKAVFVFRTLVLKDMFDYRKKSIHLHWLILYVLVHCTNKFKFFLRTSKLGLPCQVEHKFVWV